MPFLFNSHYLRISNPILSDLIKPFRPYHPGELLKEELEYRQIQQKNICRKNWGFLHCFEWNMECQTSGIYRFCAFDRSCPWGECRPAGTFTGKLQHAGNESRQRKTKALERDKKSLCSFSLIPLSQSNDKPPQWGFFSPLRNAYLCRLQKKD